MVDPDIGDEQAHAMLAAEHVHRRATREVLVHHLRGGPRQVGAHALLGDAVVCSEEQQARRAARGVFAALQIGELQPLLDLDLRLGEGSGAVLGLSLVQSAVRLMREMRTFEEANLIRPLDPRDAGQSPASR